MRYAVYIAGEDGLYEFSSSFRTLEMAQIEVSMINSWRTKITAIIIKVHAPDQVIDPGAKDFWDLELERQ